MRIPIALAFDDRIMTDAKVALSSLLRSRNDTTFYDIHVLCSAHSLSESNRVTVQKYANANKHCALRFHDLGDSFAGAFEIRGISIPTYYRLLLSSLLPECKSVLYLDVDVVVTTDLESLYSTDLSNSLLAGVKGVYQNQDAKYLNEIGVAPGEYINAGVLLMNLEQMREEDLQPRFIDLARCNYVFQDQDVLNIACKGRIRYLDPRFNLHTKFDYMANMAVSYTHLTLPTNREV